MSNIVPLRSFPEAELRALLQAWRWSDANNGIVHEGPSYERSSRAGIANDKPSVVITTASAATRAVALQTARPTEALELATNGSSIEGTALPRRGANRIILATLLFATAIGLAVVGLTVNTRFAASFGQTAEAAILLAAIGLTIDLLAIILPSTASQLWRDRHRTSAAAAWAIWLITLGMTLLAAIGFAATNIGDGVANRGKVAAEATALAADVTRLRAERVGITERRSVAAIEAELQRAQPTATAVWRQTSGCSDVTLAASGAACAEVLKLRQALGMAQRRDTLDVELRAAEARLAPLPASAADDPQAAMAADILAWVSAGHVRLTPHDIHRLRITGMTIVPALAGIIFMFAATLLRVGRQRGPAVAAL